MAPSAPNRPTPQTAGGTRGLPPDRRPRKPLPPPDKRGPEVPLATTIELARSFFTTADKLLRNSSIAYRLNPQYQMMMRADADIEGALRSLQVTLASLEWAIVPQDAEDPKQKAIAERISRIFEAIPRRSDFIRSLHEAIWYGTMATNMVYVRHPTMGIAVKEWYPFHPDTICYDVRGNPGMRVGSAYAQGGGAVINIGFDSNVHIFDDTERRAVIIHRVFVNAPDFNDPNSSESIYRGVGARDVCWFMWLAKQEVLQDVLTYTERYAMGIRVGYYPMGNPDGQATMEKALGNLCNDNSVLLPHTGETKLFDIDIKEPSAGRAQIFMELVNWLSGKLKEAILGQNLSSESGATGMGSGVANLHADTLSRIIRYHADTLADSLTNDFIRPVCLMLGISEEDAGLVRFAFAPERPDPKDRLEAIAKFVELGGDVEIEEVRDLLGLSKPREGAPILRSSADSFSGGGGMGGLGNPFGTTADPEGAPEPGEPSRFRRQRSWTHA